MRLRHLERRRALIRGMPTTHCRLILSLVTAMLVGLAISHEGGAQSASPLEHASGAHGDGHADLHYIYKHWHTPTNPGVSCCNDSDCRPTRAKQDELGNWLAWNGHKWLPVPHRALMPPDIAGDGRSHICERQEFIYCFTPAESKM